MAKKAAAARSAPAPRTGKNLVIVESPAKAKTINKYLGDDYIVKASMGHVRDLPRKGMGVDLVTFQPDYVVIEERGKDKVVSELRKLAKEAPEIYLATDLDREGEAIAWHLAETLKIPTDRNNRVVFNAITKSAIQQAFTTPRPLNMDVVNAQQARRVLDRIVGFELSPVLWKKVARGLSAGRVQSVAVRLVVEREREIEAFEPDEYWSIGAVFGTKDDAKVIADLQKFLSTHVAVERAEPAEDGEVKRASPNKKQTQKWLADHDLFEADLVEVAGKKLDTITAQSARDFATAAGFQITREDVTDNPTGKGPQKRLITLVGSIADAPQYAVRGVEKKRSTSRPSPPFITSTLQQAASTRLGFGAQRTMRAAQKLYEGGHITYMRTDSTHLSGDALTMVRGFITSQFGPKYLPEKPNFYASSNKDAQEAHEAIRPTNTTIVSRDIALGADEARLYELIYNRFVSCQMTPAQWDQTVALIDTKTPQVLTFKATGRKLVFDGFMKVAGVFSDDQLLPELNEGQRVFPADVRPAQHFTSPPPRYTEASLIKDLESKGIGRPSTYASIIQTIQDREYVLQQERRMYATLLGKVVTDKLIQAFPDILNVGFTADMEKQLDGVEESTTDWIQLLKGFYGPFHAGVEGSLEKIAHAGGAPSGITCAKCGKELLYRISANGFFLACSDRECGNTQPCDKFGNPVVREVSPYTCPTCGREMVKRGGRFGDFLSCTGYSIKDEKGKPSCSTIISLDKAGVPQPPKVKLETSIPCDKCGSPMILRASKRGPFLGCSSYPKCRSTKFFAKLEGEQKNYIEGLLPELKVLAEKAKAMVETLKAQLGGAGTNGAGGDGIGIDPTDLDIAGEDAA